MKQRKSVRTSEAWPARVIRRVKGWRPVYGGLILGVVFFCISLFPSLLPRPWWLQSVISGLSLTAGYAIGVGLSSFMRWFTEYKFPPHIRQWAWRVAAVLLPLLVVIYLFLGKMWQNDVHEILDTGRAFTDLNMIVLPFVSLAVFFPLLVVGKAIQLLHHRLSILLHKRLPKRVGVGIAIVVSAWFVYWVLSGLLVSNLYSLVNNAFSLRDDRAPEGISQPMSSLRSGSPESLIPWEHIGFQGRGFVGSGPTAEDISTFSGEASLEPIRVYAGLASADSAEAQAELALAELKRTGAFERELLVLATATGTGWLDPTVMDAVEYMHDGNTAIVSQQYSYLPSWISFLVDQENARLAGRALYDAVIDEWAEMPRESRPKLIVYGLSLGSFGGQSAFSGVNDMRRSVDGVLFVGTPNAAELWRQVTDARDPGSPEWQPTYRGGGTVQFASSREDILAAEEKWQSNTRILFQQHGSDPVVWFNFNLLFNKPAWLDETRAPDVSPKTSWYPIVSFLQIGLDQAIAASAPIGRGHYYDDTAVYAWAAVTRPDNWTADKSDALQAHLETIYSR